MIVSLGIMLAMLSIVLSGQSTYTNEASFNSVSDDIYFSLKQAQVYGVGVKEFTPGSSEFDVSYGLSFNISPNGTNDSYIFFGDRGVRNQIYDSGWACPTDPGSECVAKTQFAHNATITQICYIRTNDTEVCNLGRVDVSFTRPDPSANMVFFNSQGNGTITPSNLKGAKIDLSAPDGKTGTVIIYTTGQVSIE